MHRAKLVDGRTTPLTAGDIPVATDVFLRFYLRSVTELFTKQSVIYVNAGN